MTTSARATGSETYVQLLNKYVHELPLKFTLASYVPPLHALVVHSFARLAREFKSSHDMQLQ